MTTLFLDLIQDLREKRLWPVAVALLAATAAVPLVLLTPAHSGSSNTPQIASNSSAVGLPVVNVKNGSGPSNLGEYSTKNPFKPVGQLKSGPGAAPATSSSAPGTPGGSGGGGAAGGSGGSGGSSVSGGSGGGGSAPSTGGVPSGGTHVTTQAFAFHIDVKFGPSGHEKTYKDVKQLDMLPDAQSPVLVFMGMTSDFKTAIFLVDTSKYEAAGEGKCRPSETTCSFVELNLHDSGNEETLASTDGNSEYTLKLTGIHRVALDSSQTKSLTQNKAAAPKAKGKAKARAAAATGGKAHGQVPNPLSQLFELPSFAVRG